MPTLRLALAQGNPTVGDLEGNAELAFQAVRTAAGAGAQLVALPEMFITGYPIEDLALRPSFQAASRATVQALAERLEREGLGAIAVVVGCLDRLPETDARLGRPRGAPINAAAVIHQGRIVTTYAKHHLPNYGVFDEFRYFVPGDAPCMINVGGIEIALAICEDLWQEGGTVADAHGCGLLLVINGSPYERDKDDVRLNLCRQRARELECALAYVNMTGGQDELVFDGDSLIVSSDGQLLARSPVFTEDLLITDLDLPAGDRGLRIDAPAAPTSALSPLIAPLLPDEATVYAALVTGLRDYVDKNGFAIGQIIAAPQSARLVLRFGYRGVMTTGLSLVGLSMLGLATVGIDTSIGWVLFLFFIFGLGMGSVIAPASTVMQNVLPLARAGAGSAVQNTVRQVGGALGVALIGTILATQYSQRAAGALDGLPADVPEAARQAASNSIVATDALLDSASQAGAPAGALDAVRTGAYDAFLTSSHITYFVSFTVVTIAALVVAFLLPKITPPRKESLVPADSPIDDLEREQEVDYADEFDAETRDDGRSR